MMRQVNDYFSLKPNSTLYHYTGIGGLLGIVESRRIWASHAYYLNDSKEILHACDALNKVLSAKVGEFHGEEQEFVKQFAQWLDTFRRDAFHIFIFSLSEERSLLSQWRSYTPHGKGVSLGFSPSIVEHILKTPGYRIAQCLYENHQHVELMSGLLEKMLVTFRQSLPKLDTSKQHPTQKYHGFLENFRNDLLQVLAIVKHSAFREEREWRIVSPYFPKYTVPAIKFREGASMLMPYIELELPAQSETPLLFDEVILGPSQDNNLSLSALSSYLSNKQVCNKSSISGIPFRKWQAT
ncbi:MAG: DUF2971 domain-containing protein [Candidatus Woesebacteria bacterium]|nr:DUF2971 domain-containing protein [Candidatus Woesebacteria bacterium]